MNELSNKLFELLAKIHSELLTIKEPNITIDKKSKKWSTKEILGHLIDSAINNYRRIILAKTENTLTFEGYRQDEWVQSQNYNQMKWIDIIELWFTLNMHLARLVNNISDHDLLQKYEEHNIDEIAFISPLENQPCNIHYLVTDYIAHLEHHINQIYSIHKK